MTQQNLNHTTSSKNFEGTQFNRYDSSRHHAGPKPGAVVPAHHANIDLHYDINQIITPAQRALIKSSGILAFHCMGDTGTDNASNHNGMPYDRQDVANMMTKQCLDGVGLPETPCFCYHVGDIIYPGSDEALYEEEFYQPYCEYPNAIVAIPGNHDSYRPGGLAVYAENFMQPKLKFVEGTRPAMNLPGYYWVMDTPVATIIGMAAISNYIEGDQRSWLEKEMKAADPNKALIIAVHYPPYCFDGSDNSAIRDSIETAISNGARTPDLVISGHSHNFQQIEVPQSEDRPAYTVVVNGAGGVSVGGVRSWSRGNGSELKYYNDKEFGALTVIVDSNKNEITCNYYTAVPQGNDDASTHLRRTFTIGYNPKKLLC
ncbi:MAG: metallophosphoesterase family protein [Akkermansiaceae bacterium]